MNPDTKNETTTERPCAICGAEVTSRNPDVDFCSVCFYTGRSHERDLASEKRGNLLGRIGEIDEVSSVAVWHTGGGCFNLAVTLSDGRLLTPSLALGANEKGGVVEPGIPDPSAGEKWGIVLSENEDAWSDWDESRIEYPPGAFTDDELVDAIRDLAKTEKPKTSAPPLADDHDFGGAFDGFTVTSDADPGL